MTRKLKSVLLAIAIVVLFAIVALVYFRGSWSCRDGTWVAIGHPLSRHPQTECVKPEPPPSPPPKICSPPWSCGHWSQGEAGMKEGVYYLKYEDVTGPAKLEIVFEDNAICRIDEEIVDCAHMIPTANSSSTFNGTKDGDLFRVSNIDFSSNR